MTRTADLHQLTRLVAVQRARLMAAEAAFSEARDRAAAADARASDARAAADAAGAAWRDCLACPGFAPEFAGALAVQVTRREAGALDAAERARVATDLADHRRGDWRRCDAQVTLTGDALRDARRAARQHAEGKRLDAAADRVTWQWSRR